MAKRTLPLPAVIEDNESDNFKEDLMNAIRHAAVQRISHRRSSALDVRRRNQRLIAPSGRHYKLMRQISGLGMDDPVSKVLSEKLHGKVCCLGSDEETETEEDGSVASDPTATYGQGIDMEEFEKSLSDMAFMSPSTQREIESSPLKTKSKNVGSSDRYSDILEVAPILDLETSLVSLDAEDVMSQLNRNKPLNAENSGEIAFEMKARATSELLKRANTRNTRIQSPHVDRKPPKIRQRCKSMNDKPSNCMIVKMSQSPRKQRALLTRSRSSDYEDRDARRGYQSPPVLGHSPVNASGKADKVYGSTRRTLPSIAALFPEELDMTRAKPYKYAE